MSHSDFDSNRPDTIVDSVPNVMENVTPGLDRESSHKTSLLSNNKLSEEQKEQIKALLPALLIKQQLSEEQENQVRKVFEVDLENAIVGLKKEVKMEGQEVKKDFLTFFGLFASFVTFLSIEVQVFKNKESVFELLGITSISLSFIMFFALVINDIAKDKSEWKDFCKPTYILNIVFAGIGIFFLSFGEFKYKNRIEELEKNRELSDNTLLSNRLEINVLRMRLFNLDSTISIISKKQNGNSAN